MNRRSESEKRTFAKTKIFWALGMAGALFFIIIFCIHFWHINKHTINIITRPVGKTVEESDEIGAAKEDAEGIEVNPSVSPVPAPTPEIGKHYCANAAGPLSIKDYTGTNQPMHPKVLYFPKGWNGYKYWMSYTPYPDSLAEYENPSIAVSDDGIIWREPPGLRNPVVKAPIDNKIGAHNSDSQILMVGDKMQLWYRYNPPDFKREQGSQQQCECY